MKVLSRIFLFSAIILFTSCKTYQDVQCTGISAVHIDKLTDKGIEADIILKIKNPNSASFSIFKSEFDVSFNKTSLGKAIMTNKVKIKGSAEEKYTFKLKGDFKSVSLENVLMLIEGITRTGNFELKGDLNVGKGMAKKKIAIQFNENIKAD